jgi:hypothetical protein
MVGRVCRGNSLPAQEGAGDAAAKGGNIFSQPNELLRVQEARHNIDRQRLEGHALEASASIARHHAIRTDEPLIRSQKRSKNELRSPLSRYAVAECKAFLAKTEKPRTLVTSYVASFLLIL